MKKTSSLILASFLFSQFVSAQTPTLHSVSEWSKQKAQYEADKKSNPTAIVGRPQLSENDKAEIGTFFLLHSMAQKGLIGKAAGICVNYTKGEDGGGDKISFGIKGAADNVGSADCDKLPEIAKAAPIVKQMGKFFEKGCNGKADCMTVNVTGYSDGIRKKDASDPSASFNYNQDLAKSRANCYQSTMTDAGLNKFGDFNSQGRSSKYGQYLDIMKKTYGGDSAKFIAKLSKDDRDFFEPLFKKYGQKYNIKCDRRRVTVMDFEFNSSQVSVNQEPGKSGPNLYSGGQEFSKASFMDAALQIASVTKENLTLQDDATIDQTITKMLQRNGINDPAVIDNCKNPQTRDALKYFSARMNELSATDRADFYAKVDGGNHAKIMANAIAQNPNAISVTDLVPAPTSSEGRLFKEMTDYFDPYKRNKSSFMKQPFKYPGLLSGGISSTPLNCFSAKNAVQSVLNRDAGRLAKACKPVGHNTIDDKLSVEFEGKEGFHIGCGRCNSGLELNKGLDGKLHHTYRPRDNQSMKSGTQPSVKAQKLYPLAPDQMQAFAEKLLTFQVDPLDPVADKKYLKPDKTFMSTAQACIDDMKAFQAAIKEMVGAGSDKKIKNSNIDFQNLYVNYTEMNIGASGCKDIFSRKVKMDPEESKLFTKLFVPNNEYAREYITGVYQRKYGKDGAKVADPNVAYDVLRNPQNHYEEKFYSVQGLLHDSKDQSSHMTLGGLKSPAYYILKDCKCDDPNLMDKVAKNGEFHQMDTMPLKEKVASSGDACIVSLPVPTSCMVEITNADDGSPDGTKDPVINWLDADGADVSTVLQGGLGDLNKKINELNSNFDFDNSCPPGDALAKAEAVVKSLGCGENDDIKLPHPEDEFADCKE
jgi:hypothetical protein